MNDQSYVAYEHGIWSLFHSLISDKFCKWMGPKGSIDTHQTLL